MLRIALVLVAAALLAKAECVCGAPGDPGDWYTVYEGGDCQNPNPNCADPNPFYVVTNWACYNWFTSERVECVIDYCNSICDVSYTRAKPRPGLHRAATPAWQFDPVKLVLGIFPRMYSEWRPVGPYGQCKRVAFTQ